MGKHFADICVIDRWAEGRKSRMVMRHICLQSRSKCSQWYSILALIHSNGTRVAESDFDSLNIEMGRRANWNEMKFEINPYKKELYRVKRSNVRLQQENMLLQHENARLREENSSFKTQLKRYSETCALCDGQLMNGPREKAAVGPLPL